MTTPPTDEQHRVASDAVVAWGVDAPGLGLLADVIAQALADQAAAIHARYEKVAEECEQNARGNFMPGGYADVCAKTWGKAGRKVREVSR